MPTLVEFEGMCFEMYYKGYHSSHIKLTYGEYCYRIDIKKLEIMSGSMPSDKLERALKWTTNIATNKGLS
ncbi:MAG: DUF4160 domain-containing protein [Dehalococcoidia bacterium]|nr:DUF4160 domain-containing protein [Dehalococcoidia bacterium]